MTIEDPNAQDTLAAQVTKPEDILAPPQVTNPADMLANEVKPHFVGQIFHGGTRRIIRVNRKAHIRNVNYGTNYPTCILIEEGKDEQYFHAIVHDVAMLTEYVDKLTYRKVVGIVTYGDVIAYTDPNANQGNVPPGC